MLSVVDLWLPILLSSVAIFIASALIWMILPHHRKDYVGVPNEDGFLASLRQHGIGPGQYMFPYCSDWSELKDPEKKKRYEASSHGTLSVWKHMPSMPRNLLFTFIFYIVVGVFVAYIGSLSLMEGAEFRHVFQVTATAAVMSYCFGLIPHSIWFGRTLRSATMDIIDGIAYAAITGAIFAWLWPDIGVPPVV